MKRYTLAWLLMPGVLALVWSVPGPSPGWGEQAPSPQGASFRLVKVATSSDLADNKSFPEARDWLAGHHVAAWRDNGVASWVKKDARSRIALWPQKQAARCFICPALGDPAQGQNGLIEVTWTRPPAVWSAGQDVTLTLTARALQPHDDNLLPLGCEVSLVPPPDMVPVPGTRPRGIPKHDRIFAQAGTREHDSAAIALRLRPTTARAFRLVVQMASDGPDELSRVYYLYERVDDPLPPPRPVETKEKPHPPKSVESHPPGKDKEPPARPKEPAGKGCEKTFGKAWDTSWGRLVVCVCEGRVTGIYANREPNHGPGIFHGSLSGDNLDATWTDAGGEGKVKLTLSADGCTFHGSSVILKPSHQEGGTLTGKDPRHGSHTNHPGPGDPRTGVTSPTHPGPGKGPGPGPKTTPATDPATTDPVHSGPGPGAGTVPLTGPAFPVSSMTLLADHWRVRPRGIVTVPIWLLKGADVASLNYTVDYDTRVAVVEGTPTRGNLLSSALFSANPREPGLLRLGVAGGTGLKGTGTVANIVFRAVGQPGAYTVLHLTVTTSAGPGQASLPVATIDGSIRIMGPADALKGDCNGDGIVDARDAQCALDMSTMLIPQDPNLDMDGKDGVTAVDATLILQARSRSLLR